MNVVTHGFAPVVLAAAAELVLFKIRGRRTLTDRHFAAIAISGAMPDILWPHLSLQARLTSPTHTIWFLIASIPIAILLARWLFRDSWRLTSFLMVSAAAFHLFCDAIANGIAWLYPISNQVIGVSLVPWWSWRWIDVGSLGLAVILIYALRLLSRSSPSEAASVS